VSQPNPIIIAPPYGEFKFLILYFNLNLHFLYNSNNPPIDLHRIPLLYSKALFLDKDYDWWTLRGESLLKQKKLPMSNVCRMVPNLADLVLFDFEEIIGCVCKLWLFTLMLLRFRRYFCFYWSSLEISN